MEKKYRVEFAANGTVLKTATPSEPIKTLFKCDQYDRKQLCESLGRDIVSAAQGLGVDEASIRVAVTECGPDEYGIGEIGAEYSDGYLTLKWQ